MTAALLAALVESLKLWNTKEGTKYLDRMIKLDQEWNEIIGKPRAQRSNRELDEIELEVESISKAWVTYRKTQNA